MGIDVGVAFGREEGVISVAERMLENGKSVEDIKEDTGLSLEKINSLKEKLISNSKNEEN